MLVVNLKQSKMPVVPIGLPGLGHFHLGLFFTSCSIIFLLSAQGKLVFCFQH